MSILQVLHTLHVGGAEVLAARLARGLRDRLRFTFACLDARGTLGEELAAEGFDVHVVGRRGGFDVACARRLARIIRVEEVGLVHAHQYTPFFYSSLARGMARTRLPVLFTEHGRHHPDLVSAKRRLANRVLLRPRDRVVGVGEAVRHALVTKEGLPPERVSVIHNGVPLERFEAMPALSRNRTRDDLGLRADAFVVAQVARLDYLKDHETAIEAVRLAIDRVPRLVLLLVGEGPERQRIEEAVARHRLEANVRLLGLRSDVARILAASDAVLLTSISEGIPLTLIEAMAMRLPVVSTDVGGVSEVVVDGETGLLAPTKDAEGLARHLVSLAAEPGLRVRLGESGRQRADSHFSERLMHERYERAYRDLLARRRG